jgi:hypothetical protein
MGTSASNVVGLLRILCLGLAVLVRYPAESSAQATSDAVLEVLEISLDTVRLGENSFAITVRNRSDAMVVALLDLRAMPGMWLGANWQSQFSKELAPGEEGVIEGNFEFRRLSPEARLRVMVGPGEPREGGFFGFRRLDFQRVFDVGETSPDAYDPGEYFAISRHGPLEIYAWKGSLAEHHLDAIAAERLGAVESIAQLLSVQAPERIRIVFYPDEVRKIDQTGHQGRGWAFGTTLVEVYSEDVRLDPYHELVHVIANALGSPPPILNEGLAVYASELLGADALRLLGFPGTPVHRAVCKIRNSPDYIPLTDLLALDNIGGDENSAAREYAQAGSFVKYLVERHGWERFRETYSALSAREDYEDNVRRFYPGWALHFELEELVRAGLTPLEALTSATGTAASILGVEDIGTLRVGSRADLVVLDADPLEDIRHTRRIHLVMQAGRIAGGPQ